MFVPDSVSLGMNGSYRKHTTGMLLLAYFAMAAEAQKPGNENSRNSAPPALSAIKEAELKRDLYAMASDHYGGREAGTLDELKVSVW
jgi:hypothetical protein